MKNYKRALRRWKKEVKFKKRIKIWTNQTYTFRSREKDVWIKEIEEGKSCTFLRTTSRPCNCWDCTYEKYERTPKQKVDKMIWEDIKIWL